MSLSLRLPLAIAILAPACLTFAQDGVSTAGAARTRYLGSLGIIPTAKEVVVEDFVNYHRHEIPRPKAGETVALDLRWASHSISADGEAVLQVGISTALSHDRSRLRPLNLTLVIDKSGSMADLDKMTRVKEGLKALVSKLRPSDVISIVTFDSNAQVLLPPQSVASGQRVREAIDTIEPGSSTNLNCGLMLGYEQALQRYSKGSTNRVVLLTDGIANQGETDPKKIANNSLAFNDRGIDVSTIGVGKDLNTDLLQTLARTGRGLFHFVADTGDIRKVFEDEVQSLISPIGTEPNLEIDAGLGAQIERVYGYQPEVKGGHARISLDNFNSGMTEVVLLRLKPEREARSLPVKVRLTYKDLERNKTVVLQKSASVHYGSNPTEKDESVEKNMTIATLAEAIHAMALNCESGRYADAERILASAISEAQEGYSSGDDPDIKRVLNTAIEYRAALENRDGALPAEPSGSTNLIPNGDFSLGNRGFASDLPFVAPTENSLWPVGYTIAPTFSTPQLHRLISSQPFAAPKRSQGNEQVLFANAGGTGVLTLWSAQVRCRPNTRYRISFQSISLTPGRDWIPTYEIQVNSYRSTPQASSDGTYSTISTEWTSGSETSATIRIVRLPIPHGGGIVGIANVEMVEA